MERNSEKHALWMVTATAVMSLSMVVYHRVMSSSLGNAYADLFAVTGIINILAVFTQGVSANLAKGFAAEEERYGSGMVKASLMRMAPKLAAGLAVLGLGLYGLCLGLGRYLNIQGNLLALLMVGMFLGGMTVQVLRSSVQGMHRFGNLGVSYVTEGLGRVLFASALVLAGGRVAGALGGSILAQMAAMAVVVWALRRIRADHQGLAEREAGSLLARIRELGEDSAVLVLFSVVGYLDVLITKHHYGAQMVVLAGGEEASRAATFARASLVAKSFLYLTTALNMVLLPVVSAARAGGRNTRPVFFRFLGASAAILLVALAFVWWRTPFVITLLCGADLHVLDQADLVRWFCAAYIPMALLQMVLFYHLAVGTRRIWMGMAAGAAVYWLLLEYFHAVEMNIIVSLTAVSSVLLATGLALTLLRAPGPVRMEA